MKKVLICDLDGTLIKTDMLFESLFILLRNNFFFIFLTPLWLLKGKQVLKNEIYKRIEFSPENLPYNQEVIEFIKINRNNYSKTALVSASNQNIVKDIAEYIGIFDEYYGSDDKLNLKAVNKRKFLDEKYGIRNYSYIGDSKADIEIWNHSNEKFIVNNSLSKRLKSIKFDTIIGNNTKSKLKLIIKEIRVYQWVKNLLIFIPALMAHITNFEIYLNLFYSFISFSLIASSVYVLNDLLDLEADRKHPRKKNRPFASGDLSLLYGFALLPFLIVSSLIIAITLLPISYLFVLFFYYVLTSLYSFKLKRIVIVDILTLALLYTIRIVAGGEAVDVEVTPWALAFSMFLFLSLALLKRYTELHSLKEIDELKASGRGYHVDDIEIVRSFGTSSAFISILVFALYVNSEQIRLLYNKPNLMWIVAILLLFWIMRIWFLANRGKMTDDPIVFTGKDKISWTIGGIISLIVIYAKI